MDPYQVGGAIETPFTDFNGELRARERREGKTEDYDRDHDNGPRVYPLWRMFFLNPCDVLKRDRHTSAFSCSKEGVVEGIRLLEFHGAGVRQRNPEVSTKLVLLGEEVGFSRF